MADMIDSRKLVEEYEELSEVADMLSEGSDTYIRFQMLSEVIKELEENCGEEPENGITMIPQEAFVEYAQDYAEDVGYLGMQLVTRTGYNVTNNETGRIADTWPFKHIDWDAAAEELAEDWTEIEFDGTTYLVR